MHPLRRDVLASQFRPSPEPSGAYHHAHDIVDDALATGMRIVCNFDTTLTLGMEPWHRNNDHLLECWMLARTPRVRMSSQLLARSRT